MIRVKVSKSCKQINEAEISDVHTLVVFDFDDTIAKTHSHVFVRDKETGDLVQELPSHEFPGHKLKAGQEYDFSDFNKVIDPEELPDTVELFKNHIVNKDRAGKEVSILTARSPKSAPNIRKYLKQILKDTPNLDMFPIVGLGNSSADKKKEWIKDRVQDYPNVKKVIFIDDADANRAAVDTLTDDPDMKKRHVNIFTIHPENPNMKAFAR